jgi:ribosomal protein L24
MPAGSTNEKEARLGDRVKVISGPHEGRSGVVTYLREAQREWSDPEWYAIVRYQTTNSEDKPIEEEVAVPLKRLRPF